MKKRVVSVLLAAALSASLFAGCGGSGESTKKEEGAVEETKKESTAVDINDEEAWKKEPMYGKTLVVGYSGASCTGACYVADLVGFYEEEGVDVEVIRNGGNSTDIMTGLSSGKFVLTENHISAATVPIANGIEATMVGTAQTGCQSLYVLSDSEYKTTKDLIGKNVNVIHGVGSQDHNIILRFMAKDGLAANDYNFVSTEASAVVQGMKNGEIDASLLPDMFAYSFVKDGTLRYIRSITWDDDFKEEPCCTILMNTKFMKENPITAKKMARATAKASAWIDTHIEEATQVMMDNDLVTGDMEKLSYLHRTYDWTVTNEKCEATLKNIIKDYKELGILKDSLNEEEFFSELWYPILSQEELDEVWTEGEQFVLE